MLPALPFRIVLGILFSIFLMRLSDRYIFSELLMPFLIGTLAVLMMMVGTTLYNMLEALLRDKWPLVVVVRVLVLNIPSVLVMALPVATALAASLSTNRMAGDNEITALRASGMPLVRIFAPVLLFGLLASFADLYISDRVVPWASDQQQNIQFFLENLPKNPIEAGLTIRVENYTVTYKTMQKINDNRKRLTKVVIVEDAATPEGYPKIITADYADYENGDWTMPNGSIHSYDTRGVTEYDGAAKMITLRLPIDFSQASSHIGVNQYSLLSFEELTRRSVEARRLGQKRDAVTFEVERWFKLSLPMMCVVLALCAPPLAMRFSRGGSFTGVLLSIVVVFIAWNTLLLMKYIGLGGLLPPLVAAWSTNLLFLILGLWLLRTQE